MEHDNCILENDFKKHESTSEKHYKWITLFNSTWYPLGDTFKKWKNESADLTNFLYTLHITPILDAIGIKEIAEETDNDSTLKDLRDIFRSGKRYIPNDKPHDTPYKQVISEIKVLNNGTLLKQDKIILPLFTWKGHKEPLYIKDLDIKEA